MTFSGVALVSESRRVPLTPKRRPPKPPFCWEARGRKQSSRRVKTEPKLRRRRTIHPPKPIELKAILAHKSPASGGKPGRPMREGQVLIILENRSRSGEAGPTPAGT